VFLDAGFRAEQVDDSGLTEYLGDFKDLGAFAGERPDAGTWAEAIADWIEERTLRLRDC
jgi:hypothetical protein